MVSNRYVYVVKVKMSLITECMGKIPNFASYATYIILKVLQKTVFDLFKAFDWLISLLFILLASVEN